LGFRSDGLEFGSNSIYEFHVSSLLGASNYIWDVDGGTILDGQGTNLIRVRTYEATVTSNIEFTVGLQLENDCGESSYFVRTGWVIPGTGAANAIITPNPSSGEVTVTIASSEEKGEVETEWEVEVYTQGKQLQAEQTGITGESTTLNTTGWKDGIYLVVARYKGEVLTGKLIVKAQ
jgi:hypothetical protein